VSIRIQRRTAVIGAALATASFLALAACGSSGGSSAGSTPTSTTSAAPITKDATLAALLPASVASTGLKVGTDATYPPNEYVDGGKTVGMDVDLGNAIGQVLGVPVTFTNSPFNGILPGIQSGKYNLGISSFTANAERQKVVNFATYLSAGTQWAVAKGNPDNISIDNACGKKVAVQTATVQVDDIAARSKACTDAGKPAINVSKYQNQTDATGAVASGKAQAMLADLPVTVYAVTTTGTLQLLGATYAAAPYGIAVPCGSAGKTACISPYTSQTPENANYVKAIQGAIQKLIDGGQYIQILTKWNIQGGAITTSEINPAK